MRYFICASLLGILFLPAFTMAQQGDEDPFNTPPKPDIRKERYASLRRPHTSGIIVQLENSPMQDLTSLGSSEDRRDSIIVQMLNALLAEDDQVVKTIAKLLDLSEQKIKVVPLAYWDSPEWLAWVRKALNAPEGKLPERPEGKLLVSAYFFQRAPIGSSQYQLILEFSQPIDHPRDIAEAIAAELVQKLPNFSQRFFHLFLDKQLKLSRAECDELERRLKQVQNSIIEIDDTVSQNLSAETLADLRRQLLASQLSLHAIKARESATQSQIKIATDRFEKNSETSEITSALQQLVELRSLEVMHLKQANMKKSDAVTRGEIDQASARVVEAKIQLLTAQAKKRTGAENEQVKELNNQLTKLAIDRVETEAKLEFLNHEILKTDKELRESRIAEIQLATLEAERKSLQSEYDLCQKRSRALEKMRDSIKPVHMSIVETGLLRPQDLVR